MIVDWGGDERRLGESVSVLVGPANGAFPSGNSLLVRGSSETMIIDPSVTVAERGGAPARVDVVVNSHSHEDHLAGNGTFPAARVHIHDADLPGARSLQGLLDVYGLAPGHELERVFVEEFFYAPRPDAHGFHDGHVFDLGGGTRVEAMHLPGHTRGHSGFRIGDVFFLGDIELTGFGPYYGDVWSDLDDFEASLVRVREEDARYYVTFHHKGVIEGRSEFLRLVDAFASVIPRRHDAMLEFLVEPRTIEQIAAHRFVYRPTVDNPGVEAVERRTAELHLRRMLARGEAVETEPNRFQAVR